MPLIDGGTQRLPRVVGMGRALELTLTGRPVQAEEALRIGLVNEVVPPATHVERALELAERLAGFPQETMLADRRAMLEGARLPLGEALEFEYRQRPRGDRRRRPRRRPLRRRRRPPRRSGVCLRTADCDYSGMNCTGMSPSISTARVASSPASHSARSIE